MATLEDIRREFINKSYDDLTAYGKRALEHLMPLFKDVDPEYDGAFSLICVILSAIGADGALTAEERAFLRDAAALTDDTISAMIRMYSPVMQEVADNLFDKLDEDNKVHMTVFMLCVLAVDKDVDHEETAFLRRLFS